MMATKVALSMHRTQHEKANESLANNPLESDKLEILSQDGKQANQSNLNLQINHSDPLSIEIRRGSRNQTRNFKELQTLCIGSRQPSRNRDPDSPAQEKEWVKQLKMFGSFNEVKNQLVSRQQEQESFYLSSEQQTPRSKRSSVVNENRF